MYDSASVYHLECLHMFGEWVVFLVPPSACVHVSCFSTGFAAHWGVLGKRGAWHGSRVLNACTALCVVSRVTRTCVG